MTKTPKPRKISPGQLKKRGYKWKLQHLTKEEKDWAANGIPVEGKPNQRRPAPDYFYYYKPVEGGECRIYKVGDGFYYGEGGGGVPIKTVDQIEKCEELSRNNAKYAEMQKNLQDTEPKFIIKESEKPYEFDKGDHHNTPPPPIKEGEIRLKGGPLDGKIVPYNNKFPFYMTQVMTGTGKDRHIVAPRYQRNKEDKNVYDYKDTM